MPLPTPSTSGPPSSGRSRPDPDLHEDHETSDDAEAEDDFNTASGGNSGDDPSDTSGDTMVDFETEDTADGADAQKLTASLKIDFDRTDVEFWFMQLEMHLTTAGVNAQWTKRLLLHKMLPADVVDEVKDLLRKSKANAGAHPYKDLKERILETFGIQPEDAFAQAEALMLTGKPSQLLHKLINIVCVKHPDLVGCCAAGQVSGMWRRRLPPEVRQRIAGMSIVGKDKMKDTCGIADSAHANMKVPVIAAAAYNPALGLDTSADAPALQQVAAATKKYPPRKKQQSGGHATSKTGRGEPHSDNPPASACNTHWKYGRSAFICRKKDTCPWAHLAK